MQNKDLARKVFFVVTLLINAILIAQIFGDLHGFFLYYFFNSDGLYLASIYKDVFIDQYGFKGWHLNASPNFIPEWPLYFLIRYITGDFRITAFVYSLISFLILNVLTAWLLKVTFKRINYSYLALVNLGYAVFLEFYIVSGAFVTSSFLFFSGYHNGAFIMALICLILFGLYLKTGKNIYSVFLFISVVFGVVSDRLLIMYYVVPSLTALFFTGNTLLRRNILISAVIGVAGAVAGMTIYNLIRSSDFFYIINLGYRESNFSEISSAFNNFVEEMVKFLEHGKFKRIMVILVLIALPTGLFLSFNSVFGKKKYLTKDTIERIMIVTFTSYIVVVMFTPIVNGLFYGTAHLRYNVSSLAVGVSFLVVIILLLTRNKAMWRNTVDILTGILIVLAIISIIRFESKANTVKGLKDLFSLYPEDVALIDSVASAHNLKYGVAHYWDAKRTTMFSKEDLRIYTVYGNIKPWFHVTNQNWYRHSDKGRYADPVFNFIVVNELEPRGEYFEKLTADADTLINTNILILKVPEFIFNQNNEPQILEKENKTNNYSP